MAGKTGTSQVRRISRAERLSGVRKNEEKAWEERDHGLFVAFAPYREPRYAVAVVVEHGGNGSQSAAPIARDIMAKALELDPARTRPAISLEWPDAPQRGQA
jgi:penicillin-binding protein 2